MAAIEQISIKANIFSKNTLEILWMLTNIACSRRNVNPLKMPPPPVLSGKVPLKYTNRYLAKDIDPRVMEDHVTIEQIQNHTNCSTPNTRTMVSTREEVGNGRCKDEDKKPGALICCEHPVEVTYLVDTNNVRTTIPSCGGPQRQPTAQPDPFRRGRRSPARESAPARTAVPSGEASK